MSLWRVEIVARAKGKPPKKISERVEAENIGAVLDDDGLTDQLDGYVSPEDRDAQITALSIDVRKIRD